MKTTVKIAAGILGFLALLILVLTFAPDPAGRSGVKRSQIPYGTIGHLASDCIVGRSEYDYIEILKRAQEGDALSAQQMITGGKGWSMPAGSRVTVLGGGVYSNLIEVRFADDRQGWIGPKSLIISAGK